MIGFRVVLDIILTAAFVVTVLAVESLLQMKSYMLTYLFQGREALDAVLAAKLLPVWCIVCHRLIFHGRQVAGTMDQEVGWIRERRPARLTRSTEHLYLPQLMHFESGIPIILFHAYR